MLRGETSPKAVVDQAKQIDLDEAELRRRECGAHMRHEIEAGREVREAQKAEKQQRGRKKQERAETKAELAKMLKKAGASFRR